MKNSRDEGWLDALRGADQKVLLNDDSVTAALLRNALLRQSNQLDNQTPNPDPEGLAIIKARVHQLPPHNRISTSRRGILLGLMTTLTILAGLMARFLVPIEATTTRGENRIWVESPYDKAKNLSEALTKAGANPELTQCISIPSKTYKLCLPSHMLGDAAYHLTGTLTPEARDVLLEEDPPIEIQTDANDHFLIIIARPNKP